MMTTIIAPDMQNPKNVLKYVHRLLEISAPPAPIATAIPAKGMMISGFRIL